MPTANEFDPYPLPPPDAAMLARIRALERHYRRRRMMAWWHDHPAFWRLIGATLLGAVIMAATAAAIAIKARAEEAACAHKWEGQDRRITRPFHMPGPWEIQWRMTPGSAAQRFEYFGIRVRKRGAAYEDWKPAANQNNANPGSAYQDKGGDFYLEIDGYIGPWSVCIVPVP